MSAYHNNSIASGEGDDVSAGNNSRASFLKSCLGCIDQVEAVDSQIGTCIQLRLVSRSALNEYGCIATLHT
jgi:hypothetical protein